MSVFTRFFCVIAFSGVSQRWEFKSTTKKVLQKNRVEKFYKKSTRKSETDFLDFFNHVFGRFSARGSQKHDLKSRKKSDQHWYFLLFWPPRGANQQPTTNSQSIFFKGPLQQGKATKQAEEVEEEGEQEVQARGAEGKNKNKNKNKKGAMVPHVVAICQIFVAFQKKTPAPLGPGWEWPQRGFKL
jgi:hypothetical protein